MGTSENQNEEVRKASEMKQMPLFAELPLLENCSTLESEPTVTPLGTDVHFTEALLGLSTINGLGHHSLKALTARLSGNLSDIWGASLEEIEGILTAAKTPAAKRIAQGIRDSADSLRSRGQELREEMESGGIEVIPYHSLPSKLRSITDDPLYWLFVEGDPDVVTSNGPMVAVVGTRNPSPDGRKAAERLVRIMARYPALTLVSGLAEGIDEVAHRESLRHKIKNLAFLGHGISHVFPESTRELRDLIVAQGGAVATEYLPNEKYRKAFFVRRNRLQAAISDLVIPVEAAEKSGTAHTVRFAHAYGKPIIGLRWIGANGILTAIDGYGHKTIDILSDPGAQQIDAILREMVERHHQDVFAFEQTKKMFIRELNTRRTRPEDLERLIDAIRQEFSKENPSPER